MTSETPQSQSSRTLCVDLDGTLIRSDLLLESLCLALKRKPWLLLLLPFWLLRGKAYLKRALAAEASVDAAGLPFNEELLSYLRAEHAKGRKIVLATASNEKLARAVAEHLGFFTEVHASDDVRNLKGPHKLECLLTAYGEGGFDYVGNHASDAVIWAKSSEALAVGDEKRLSRFIPTHVPRRFFSSGSGKPLKTFLRAIRVHQWVKNLLLFVPLVMAHRVTDLVALSHSFIAFASFCLCSSSVYVLNDLFDLESDRQHHSKRHRPLASGQLPLLHAFAIIPIFLILSLALSLTLPVGFTDALVVYFILTLSYSLRLKQMVLIDILVLAGLYTIRILAGGFATDVRVSEWLLGFSMFFFLSLACVKRFSELYVLRQSNKQHAKGRGYVADDLEQIAQFGSASGYLSVLVLALYVSSKEVVALYGSPRVLWLMCPLLLYWISRVWLIAHRGKLHDDPIVFALQDRTSYVVGLSAALLLMLAL